MFRYLSKVTKVVWMALNPKSQIPEFHPKSGHAPALETKVCFGRLSWVLAIYPSLNLIV